MKYSKVSRGQILVGVANIIKSLSCKMASTGKNKDKSKDDTPRYVEVEMRRRGLDDENEVEVQKKRVYVTEICGVISLDLYSGWTLEGEELKFKLEQLPVKVCSFTNLERLWLSHNNLSQLPRQVDQLANLRELYVHHNSFTAIPAQLYQLKKLEIVWFSSNEIDEIQPEISQWTSLRHLHLEHNYIKQFEPQMCALPKLEVLYLNHNQLKTIPDAICDLAGTIRRLYLHYNKLETIPDALCRLIHLEVLYLQNNYISYPPRTFEAFQQILEENKATIQIDNNPFVIPRSKAKLSVTASPNQGNLKSSRRHSDHPSPADQLDPSRSPGRGGHSQRYSVPSGDVLKELPAVSEKSASVH